MRNSALLASALAVGASALPHLSKRATITRVRTEVAYATVTVVVTVTAGVGQATSTSSFVSSSAKPTSSSVSIGLSPLPSSAAQSQPPIRISSAVPEASGTGVPVSESVTLSPVASSSAAPIVSTLSTSIVVSIAPSSASSATSVASSAPAPVLTPSVAAVSSSAAPVASASPSPSPGVSGIGPNHVSGPQQAFLAAGADYENAILFHHNAARANHGAGPLTWDTACENAARAAAQTCNFKHYTPPGVTNQGQNLFTVSGRYFNVTAGITESWYKGEFTAMSAHYGKASLTDDVFHKVGHLTQMLWKSTTGVGCVSLDCGDSMIVDDEPSTLNKFTVCNYSPQGNIGTLYGQNVGLPISSTNLGSWAD